MTPTIKTDDSPPATSPTDLRELFPALHLLRASGLAIDPRKTFLGGLALVLLAAGNWFFAGLPFASEISAAQSTRHQTSAFTGYDLLSCAGFLPRPPIYTWMSWNAAAFALLTPIRTLVEPGRVLFQIEVSWSSLAFAWTQLLWALIVWSLVGGALCRMNALQFATRKRIGIWAALKFSRRQLLGYLVAPILPLSAVLILQGFNWLLGCMASLIPSVGDVALGLGWCFVLFSGFLMAMLILALAAGWPLMIAAVSTEDSDGFDGLSRAVGYIVDRPWHFSMFAACCLPIFGVSRFLVAVLIGLAISLGPDAVTRGYDTDSQTSSFRIRVQPATSISTHNPAGSFVTDLDLSLTGSGGFSLPHQIPALPIAAWTLIPALLYVGFGPSFFWSATTVSYFLLRQSDDGTPLNSVVDWPEKVEPEAPTATDTASIETPSDDQA